MKRSNEDSLLIGLALLHGSASGRRSRAGNSAVDRRRLVLDGRRSRFAADQYQSFGAGDHFHRRRPIRAGNLWPHRLQCRLQSGSECGILFRPDRDRGRTASERFRKRGGGSVCGSLVKGTTTSREKSLRCIFFSVTASVSWNRMARPGCCIRGSVFHSRSSGLRNSGGAGSPFFRGAAIRELRRESRTASAAPDRIRHKEDLRLLQEIFRRSVELIPPEPA